MEIVLNSSIILAIVGFLITQTLSFIVFCITIWKDLYVLKAEVEAYKEQDSRQGEDLKISFSDFTKEYKEDKKDINIKIDEEVRRLYKHVK